MARFANTIDNQPIYAARAEADKNGNRIDTTYAKLTDIPNVPVQDVEVDGVSVVNGQGVAEITIPAQEQANWNESDSSDPSYIQNKPDLSIYAESADLATVATTGSYDDLTDKPDLSVYAESSSLATVATTGSYDDLTDKPTIPAAQIQSDWTESDSTSKAYIQHKPDLSIYAQSASLATVATSGDYSDLSNKPTIPAAQVNSDWDAATGVAQILNKPDLSVYAESSSLATVATTGDYSDLTNKPTIPAAQVQSNWNESDNTSKAYIQNKPDLSVYAQSANLATVATTGDYADLSNKPSLATVATTGDYDDLTNKPAIPAAQVNSDWNAASGVAQILNKPNLATVATTGSYNDLTNKPTIPAAVTVDQHYDALSSNPQSGTAVAEALSGTGQVPTVTSSDDSKVLMASYSGGQGSYAWQPTAAATQVNSDWDANSGVAQILNKPDLSVYAESANLATVATSGDYNDLSNRPSIPAAQVNSDWNASSGVSQILNKPVLATVATSGDYADLSNKPTIPAAQVQSNWNEADSTSKAYIQNKPDLSVYAQSSSLATVATTGDYDDLVDAPTIVNIAAGSNVTITEANNTVTIAATDTTYTAGTGISISGGAISNSDPIPSHTSTQSGKVLGVDSNGDLDWVTPAASQVQANWNESDNTSKAYIQNKPDLSIYAQSANLATVATTGDYDDLTNKPTIPAAQVQSNWNEADSTSKAYIQNKPDLSIYAQSANLATVATTGDYSDLSNTPTIPAAQVQSDWNESDTAAASYIQNKPTVPTVDQSYNALSANAQSGTAVAGALSGISQVPSTSQASAGDVLTVDQYGDAAWVAPSGGTSYSAGTGLSLSGTTFNVINPLPSLSGTVKGQVLSVDGNGGSKWGSVIFDVPVSMMGPSDDLANDIVTCVTYGTRQVFLSDPVSGYKLPLVSADYNGQGYTLHDRVFKGSATSGSKVYSIEVYWDTTYSAWLFTSSSVTIPSGNQLLPSATSSDEGKVLSVDSNGDPEWASVGGGSYTAGNGINISAQDVISVDTTVVATQTDLASKQDTLTAGSNVSITNNVISATDTTYSAGTGIDITNNEISVEAPVDIVAGPGIVIDNPDGNTLRVSTDENYETVLWSGEALTGITLSESLTNFEQIKVVYSEGAGSTRIGYFVTNHFDDTHLAGVGSGYYWEDTSDYPMHIHGINLSISSNAVTVVTALAQCFSITNNAFVKWDIGSSFRLLKIVGIHRIANN